VQIIECPPIRRNSTPGKNGKFSEPRVPLTTRVAETGSEHKGFRAMDGVKNGVGLEIQFGKYAFMGYDILSNTDS
jgi:hypothetical protein